MARMVTRMAPHLCHVCHHVSPMYVTPKPQVIPMFAMYVIHSPLRKERLVADLIPARGYVAVFTGITPDGRTTYHYRPLVAWTVGEDGHLVGHYVNGNGQTVVASNVPNFHRYLTEDELPAFDVAQYRVQKSAGSEPR